MLESLWQFYLWVATGFGLIILTIYLISCMILGVIFTVDYIRKTGDKNGR